MEGSSKQPLVPDALGFVFVATGLSAPEAAAAAGSSGRPVAGVTNRDGRDVL